MKSLDLSNLTFGRWMVLSPTSKKSGHQYYLCRCTCGKEREVNKYLLLRGESRSCGCLQYEEFSQKFKIHGMTGSKEYRIWSGMIQRCFNKKTESFKNYGARGIVVCERWMSFENFFYDMGKCPDGCSIDRIDNNGGYCPENCRWADRITQANNMRNNFTIDVEGIIKTVCEWSRISDVKLLTIRKRVKSGVSTKDSVFRSVVGEIEYLGKKQKLSKWATDIGISHRVLRSRIYEKGWSIEKSFTTPLRRQVGRVAILQK